MKIIIGASKICDVSDFSVETLIADTIEILEYIVGRFPNTSIVMVGHSMGGSIATKTTAKVLEHKSVYPWYIVLKGTCIFQLLALFVIDVVEGVAMEALPFMDSIVHSKPKSFKTVEAAIKWK